MPHAHQRRKRRSAVAVQNLIQFRGDLAAFAAEACRIAATDVNLWRAAAAVAEQTGTPLDGDELAVLAQAIDRRRAPHTPGSVVRRYVRGAPNCSQVARLSLGR